MATTYVKRDPFARGEYRRESHPGSELGAHCNWCGTKKRTLYSYTWESDGSTSNRGWADPKLYCDLSCYESYNG